MIVQTKFDKGEEVYGVMHNYGEHIQILKMVIEAVVAQGTMPPGFGYDGLANMAAPNFKVCYFLSNCWFAEEDQIFKTLEEAVQVLNSNNHKQFIGT